MKLLLVDLTQIFEQSDESEVSLKQNTRLLGINRLIYYR